MGKAQKHIIVERLCELSCWDFCTIINGNVKSEKERWLKEISQYFDVLSEEYKKYSSLEIIYDDYDDLFILYGEREETDKEYNKRLQSLEKKKLLDKKLSEQQLTKDKKEFERLKKKLGL